jgi:uncharacterized membrane protein YqgA involved in biofilm formation
MDMPMKRTHAGPRIRRKILGALIAMVAISLTAQMIPPWGSVALILFSITIGCVLGGALLLEIYHRLRQTTDILHPYQKGFMASGLLGIAAALIVLFPGVGPHQPVEVK